MMKCNGDGTYCENTVGSFTCECDVGYEKNDQGKSQDLLLHPLDVRPGYLLSAGIEFIHIASAPKHDDAPSLFALK